MPARNKSTSSAFPAHERNRNAEGYRVLKDGSLDGRSLRATGRTAKFGCRVDPDFCKEVKLIAARTGKTIGQIVQEAVRAQYPRKGKLGGPNPV
jgi:hypothetical protein